MTGADGFIGSHLTQRLLDQGTNVEALALYNSFSSTGWLSDVEETNAKLKIQILLMIFGKLFCLRV